MFGISKEEREYWLKSLNEIHPDNYCAKINKNIHCSDCEYWSIQKLKAMRRWGKPSYLPRTPCAYPEKPLTKQSTR